MLTGEIETAIIFALPTVGPAIVGSMAVGDVYVTATFMMVLSATLIVGNIIADMRGHLHERRFDAEFMTRWGRTADIPAR